jgi:NAD(P)-dependent dehydrogenase (short-subunit alcohol dehydrogenase family)
MPIDAWSCAYVTGGSSGIGLEMARRCADRGLDVAVFSRRPERALETLRAARRSKDQRVFAYATDVSDATAVRTAFDRAASDCGPPDLVFNSAGIVSARPFDALPGEEFARVIAVNLVGSRNVAAAAVPLLRPGGTLALVASLAGHVGCYGYAAYAASKFGVIGLAEVLRIELAPRGIAVSVICPPEVETPMVEYERTVRPPQTTAMKQLAGTLPVETACTGILHGLERGRFMIIPGRLARATAALQRYAPRRITQGVADWIVARSSRVP